MELSMLRKSSWIFPRKCIYKQTFQILFLLRPLKGMSELKHTDRTMWKLKIRRIPMRRIGKHPSILYIYFIKCMANLSLALFDELFLKLYQMLKLIYLKFWLDLYVKLHFMSSKCDRNFGQFKWKKAVVLLWGSWFDERGAVFEGC